PFEQDLGASIGEISAAARFHGQYGPQLRQAEVCVRRDSRKAALRESRPCPGEFSHGDPRPAPPNRVPPYGCICIEGPLSLTGGRGLKCSHVSRAESRMRATSKLWVLRGFRGRRRFGNRGQVGVSLGATFCMKA